MITIPWWVLPLAIAGGIGFCALMVTIWIGRIDSLVTAPVPRRPVRRWRRACGRAVQRIREGVS